MAVEFEWFEAKRRTTLADRHTRINAVLRSFVQAREREEPAPKQRAGRGR